MPVQVRWVYGPTTAAWLSAWQTPSCTATTLSSPNTSDTSFFYGSSTGSTTAAGSTRSASAEISRYPCKSSCTEERIIARKEIGSIMEMDLLWDWRLFPLFLDRIEQKPWIILPCLVAPPTMGLKPRNAVDFWHGFSLNYTKIPTKLQNRH